MTNRAREKGALTSESFGISVLHQPDIDLWSSSAISGFAPPGEDIFPTPPEILSEMAHFSEQYLAKSESGSSMDDSAYVSQADAAGRSTAQHESLMSQSFEQLLGSPALSSVSHGGFQAQFSLPDSAADSGAGFSAFSTSDAGTYGSNNVFSSPTNLDLSGNSIHRAFDSNSWSSPAFNSQFGMYEHLPSGGYFQHSTVNPQFTGSFTFSSEKILSNSQTDRALKRPQLPRMHLDTAVLNPSSLTSPSPLSATQPIKLHRSASARSSSTVNPTSDAQYEHSTSFFKASSLQSPSNKSTSDLKDDELDEESISAQTATSRAAEDAESKLARTHPLYQASPGEDDMYHCPHEGKPGCNHKPTKLKCNYDKYVDSHLRPYKCKVPTCQGIQFSSTACLLRHEREAHGMHGHGSKPNLCSFPDCERSIPGNGFPRRYNLYDHMKRVHDYTPSVTTPDEISPTIPAGPPTKRPGNRKRRSTAASDEPSEKRQKSITLKVQSNAATISPQENIRIERVKGLRNEWSQRYSATQQRLQTLQSSPDMQLYTQLSDDIAALQSIAQKITELGG